MDSVLCNGPPVWHIKQLINACSNTFSDVFSRSIRAKHFLIHEDGVVKLSGLRSMVSMIDGGSRVKVGKERLPFLH